MAKENEYIAEASKALFMMNADDLAREHSYARQDRLRYERTMLKRMEEKDIALAEKDIALAQMAQEIAELKAQLAAKK